MTDLTALVTEFQVTTDPTAYVGRFEHPRLILVPSALYAGVSIPAARTRVTSSTVLQAGQPSYLSRFNSWIAYHNSFYLDDGVLETEISNGASKGWELMNLGFLYQMRMRKEETGLPADTWPTGVVSTYTPDEWADRALLAFSNPAVILHPDAAFFWALAYDWLYEAMSGAERIALAERLIPLIRSEYVSKQLDDQGSTREGGTAMIALALYHPTTPISADVAAAVNPVYARLTTGLVYGISTTGATTGYAGFMDWLNDYNQTGEWSDGFGYSAKGFPSGLYPYWFVDASYASVHGTSRWLTFPALRYYANWYLSHLRPEQSLGEQRIEKGHQTEAYFTGKGKDKVPIYLSAARGIYETLDPTAAALAQWAFQYGCLGDVAIGEGTADKAQEWLLSYFLFGPTTAPVTTPPDTALGTKQSFLRSGERVYRSRWCSTGNTWDTGATYFRIQADQYSRRAELSRSNYGIGHWTFARKGLLALQSGTSVHHDYANRTVAHNLVQFVSPLNPIGEQRDGPPLKGTAPPQPTAPSVWQPGSAWDMGGIEREADTTREHYAYANLSRTHQGGQITGVMETVVRWTRQWVWWRRLGHDPDDRDVLVMTDRVETEATTVEPRWTVHTPTLPTVTGAGTPDFGSSRLQPGVVQWTSTGTKEPATLAVYPRGHTRYPASSTPVITWANAAGVSMRATVLSPTADVWVVGGPNANGAYGHPYQAAKLVSSIVRSDTTATVTLAPDTTHTWTTGTWVCLTDAASNNYRGLFQVAAPTSNSFQITVSGTPDNETTGARVWSAPSYENLNPNGTITIDAANNTGPDSPDPLYVPNGPATALSGAYRWEAVPAVAATTAQFLVAMEVDDDAEAASSASLINGTGVLAVLLNTTLTVFGKQASLTYTDALGNGHWVESRLTSGAFVIPDTGIYPATYRTLLTDLEASVAYTVTSSDGSDTIVDLASGTSPFTTSSGGTLSLTVTTVGAAHTLTITKV